MKRKGSRVTKATTTTRRRYDDHDVFFASFVVSVLNVVSVVVSFP